MYKPYEPHQIEWRGVPIEVRYCPSWSKSHEDIYGERMAHLEIRVLDEPRSPLPMTETGYRSHFIHAKAIEGEGGPVAYVRAWLEEEAQSPKWKELEAASRQMSLL